MFIRILWFLVGAVFSLSVAVSIFTAVGQSDSMSSTFQPFVVDIHQSVPVELSIPISNTTAPSLTLPLTLGVSLRVNIDGPHETEAKLLSTGPAEIDIATATPSPDHNNKPIFDDVIWNLSGAENLGSTADISIFSYDTSGKFILVDLLLENAGKMPVGVNNIVGLQTELVDDIGRQYDAYPITSQISEQCKYARMNPGVLTTCFILFEVATDAANLKLRLTQDQHVAEIDLELP